MTPEYNPAVRTDNSRHLELRDLCKVDMLSWTGMITRQ